MVQKQKKFNFRVRQQKVVLVVDKILLFRTLQKLHGRFWGLATLQGISIGLALCFLIRPELMKFSTAFSDFGNDVRSAPYFAGTMFFTAYGLWRWRNYLANTLRRSQPVIMLLTLTIIGFYLVALMPVSWYPWPHHIHIFGAFLAGLSMAATVVLDGLLLKVRSTRYAQLDRLLRLASVSFILGGGYITYLSSDLSRRLHVSLLGELFMLIGYGIWVLLKTVRGEGPRSRLSLLLRKAVIFNKLT